MSSGKRGKHGGMGMLVLAFAVLTLVALMSVAGFGLHGTSPNIGLIRYH